MSSRPIDAEGPARSTRVLTLVAIVALTGIAFGGVARNGWIFLDDHGYVTQEPHVLGGLTWEGFTWFLRTPHVGNWHPLTSLSHMLDVELAGTSPRGPHVTNLVLHVLTTVLLAHVLWLYTRRFWASACVAALFALHPLRVESVAWISERKDVLSGLFFVLTLWAWHGWIRRPGALRMTSTAALLFLGLCSKSMLVTTPFVLMLLETWPLRRPIPWRKRLLEKWPLFLLTLVFVGVTLVAQSQSGATADLEVAPFHSRITTALTACTRYLGKTFLPIGLAPMYPYELTVEAWFVALSGLVLLVLTVLVVRQRSRRPYGFTGWFWFLGMLVPVMGLVQVGSQSHADRYTYLPGIGLAIGLVFLVDEWTARFPRLRAPIQAACGAAVLALTLLTRAQVELWHDSRTLFAHTLRVTRDNPTGQKMFGDCLLEEGDFLGAMEHYREAVRLAPTVANGRKNLGCALARAGRPAEAVPEFQLALAAEPSAENFRNLGFALGDSGRFEDALDPLRRASSLEPANAAVHARLGAMLVALDRLDQAALEFRLAIDLAPLDLESRRALARTELQRGDPAAGVMAYRDLLTCEPDDLETLVNLARLLATHPSERIRDGAEAVRCAERARQLTPEPIAFLEGALASAYAETGRFDDAVQAATRAVLLARSQADEALCARLQAELEEYRAGRPHRTK